MAKIKAARAKLEEALQKATFSTASFGHGSYEQIDLTCKKETELYRSSWLIPPLMDALRMIDPCKKCKGEHWFHYRDCPHCSQTGIDGGLSFDPYELSRKAVKEAEERATNYGASTIQ